ncbi:phosphatase PAP2 family protein [Halobacterium litoreum]|uniref:Phosphatase PAP2 family protein n=1 Tax=Halobacterium litoreum TaxID=2039234 RepID=A0ABD5NEH0_9EURY|nr:phosphatase PAP2 family protein [Halobacterium litoreum]UHH13591.1 phosphatase PAP2 family protein [Halobacterium litoreum]
MTGRGVGVTDAIAGSVPDALVPALVALTFLGSTWFITTVGPALYLFGPRRSWLSRRNGARLLAVSIGALALVVLTKGAFAEPRPPETVMLIAEDGNGFPSGHATGAAAFYGAVAALLGVGSRARRALAAGGFVVFVAFTRLALGVHYLVDVVAGTALGLAFVGVALALTRRRVAYGFALAVALAVAAVGLLGPTEDAVAALGGTVGALAGWLVVDSRNALDAPVRTAPALAAVAVLGGSAALTLKMEAAAPVIVGAHALAGVAFVALPAVQNVSR